MAGTERSSVASAIATQIGACHTIPELFALLQLVKRINIGWNDPGWDKLLGAIHNIDPLLSANIETAIETTYDNLVDYRAQVEKQAKARLEEVMSTEHLLKVQAAAHGLDACLESTFFSSSSGRSPVFDGMNQRAMAEIHELTAGADHNLPDKPAA